MRLGFGGTAYLLIAAATWHALPPSPTIEAAPPPAADVLHSPQCRDGHCAAHCPVRPSHFGYYPTQWRRWPDRVGAASAVDPAPATPAKPPRSVLPGIDEESPQRPNPDASRKPDDPRKPDASLDKENLPNEPLPEPDAKRLERLSRESQAAAGGGPGVQGRFTESLIAAILAEHNPAGRCHIVRLASGFDTPAASAICVGALQDPDSRVRMTACQVCGVRADAQAIAALARCLETDLDPAVRRLACAMLVGRHEAEALAALRRAVDDADPEVRARAVAASAAKPASTWSLWPLPSWAKKPQTNPPAAAPSERRF